MSTSAFIADRTDGLGERLRALTNTIYLADKYDARMFFEWKNRQGRQRKYNSIYEESKIFSQEFIHAHSFSANEPEVLMLEEVDFRDFAKQISHASLTEDIRVRVHQYPPYRYISELRRHYIDGGFAAAFWNIHFDGRIAECISNAQNTFLPSDATAVHLRAGDIIYGIYSTNARFCGKAIPWEIADSIIGDIRSTGANVVLFGQDSLLLSYLASKHQAYLATTLLDSEEKDSAEIALQEILLMSRCSRIVSGSSGFAFLASSLAGEIHQNISRLVTSPTATVLSSLSSQVDPSISVEQQSFSLRWLIGMYGHSLPSEKLLEVAQHGLSLMPHDLFFLLTKASAMSALGYTRDSHELVSSAISSSSISKLRRMLTPSAFGGPESSAYLLNRLLSQLPSSVILDQ